MTTVKEKSLSQTKVLNNILKIPLQMSGIEYIREMALNFAREMNFKLVSIGRPTLENPAVIQTDAFIIDNQLQSNVTYKLEDPCLELIHAKRFCTFPENVVALFPGNIYFKENNIVSYVGAPILSHDNQTIGVIFALSETPFENSEYVENIIELLAGRLAVEFERMKTDDHLKKINLELESIINERTAHLKEALSEIKVKEQQLEMRYNENVNMLRLISHDLANPLQILGMCIEAMADRCPPDLSRLVERMKRSTDTMTQILSLVRELQAFGAGKKVLKIESVCVDEIIEKSRFSFQDKLKEKNITLNYKKSEVSLSQVRAEKISLCNNVFNNLLSNAIKFSEPNSSIDIEVDQTQSHVTVKISDHGIGIPSDLLPYIFSSSKMTSRPGTIGEKGTGFGMPLVKLFLDLYGVKVSVLSTSKDEHETDHGTCVELTFQKAS